MAQTMTRGQIQDLLAKFSVENAKYREALIQNPKSVVEKQFNKKLGTVQVKSVVETADTMYVIVPHVPAEGELSDRDLEKVAGGFLDFLAAEINCEVTGALNIGTVTQISL
jgi:hypothetical protein